MQRKPATQSFSVSRLSIGPNPEADRNQRAPRLSRRLSLRRVARSPPDETATPPRLAFAHLFGKPPLSDPPEQPQKPSPWRKFRRPGKERRRVGGNSRRRSPRRAWPRAGPVIPSPLRSYAAAVKEMSAADDAPVLSRSPLRVSADRLVRFGDGLSRTRREARSTGPFMPALRNGMKGRILCFPIGRCEGTLYGARSRRLAG